MNLFKTITTKLEVNQARKELLALSEELQQIAFQMNLSLTLLVNNILDKMEKDKTFLLPQNKFDSLRETQKMASELGYEELLQKCIQIHLSIARLKVNI